MFERYNVIFMSKKDDRREIIESIMKNALVVKRAVTNCRTSALRDRPITPNQWIILTLLMEKGEMTLKDIAKALDITSAIAMQLVTDLCDQDYIYCKGDIAQLHKMVVTLTEQHIAEIHALRDVILDRFMDVFHVLNNIELECLAALSERVADHCRVVEGTS